MATAGIVYVSLLRGLYELTPAERVADTGLHYLSPLLVVVGWVLFGPRPRISVRTIMITMLFPVLWLAYTLVRGELTGEYPYPFLDVEVDGYAAVTLNCLGVTALFVGIAAVYLVLGARLGARPSSPARTASATRLRTG